jgi:hypothetical protein
MFTKLVDDGSWTGEGDGGNRAVPCSMVAGIRVQLGVLGSRSVLERERPAAKAAISCNCLMLRKKRL